MSKQTHYDEWIRSGPQAVEEGFEKSGAASAGSGNRYLQYIEALNREKVSKNIAFLLGYFYRQAGKRVETTEEQRKYFEKSLLNYDLFLEGKGRRNPDALYFAQWQKGILQQALGNKWPMVEKSLLQTLEYDPTRAEAVKNIIGERYDQKEWRIAYIYSSYCMDQFLGKRPTDRYWQVDDDFYHWKILRYHLPILMRLRKKEEASEAVIQLKDRVRQYATRISEKDRDHVNDLIQKVEAEL